MGDAGVQPEQGRAAGEDGRSGRGGRDGRLGHGYLRVRGVGLGCGTPPGSRHGARGRVPRSMQSRRTLRQGRFRQSGLPRRRPPAGRADPEGQRGASSRPLLAA
ncbi:hypothetical protein Slala03_47740 [Streptomyces lavendulae subsp. lavendulae]|nr:hypothetical protein Slala03_47740 [Streptomyces lavendulae subsp. lavendulae]